METEITDIGKVAITPRKDYKNEQTYEWLDVVTYDGAGYMCIAEDGCTGIVPTNTDYWQLLADKGHFTEEDKEEFKKAVVEESKTKINEHTGNKKTELNNYTTELEKSLENELDTYKTEKEAQLDLHKATLETEMANKKDSLIEEIETAQNGFDTNVEEKTNTFNSNVETKTTEFNNNSNAKTEEFNNNSTEKINNFNSNAEEKIADYNEHVETLTSRIADLEEETDDLFNALDTEKASGNELYIDDAKACRVISNEIDGMYKQTTTTGKNKLDISKMYPIQNLKDRIDIDINKTDLKITVKNGGSWRVGVININNLTIGNTYSLSFSKFTNSSNADAIIGIYKSDGSYIKSVTLKNSNSLSFSTTEEAIELRIGYSSSCAKGDILVISDLMLEEGTTATEYEPYTGKIPSPNPDYPQAIEQVDSVKLQYTGSNLLNYTQILSTPNTTSGITIKLEANGNITISGKPKYSYFSVIQSKNIIDILKDGETYYLDQSNYNRYFYTEIQAIKVDGSITYIGPQKSCASFKVNKSLFKKYVIRIIGGSLTNWGEEERTVTSNFKLTRQKNLPFEKYIEKTVNIDLKGNKLCAISDTIKDKLLIDRNGNVALQKNVNYSTFSAFNSINGSFTKSTQFILNISNCVKNVEKNSFNALSNCMLKNTTDGGMGFYGTTTSGNVRITVLNSLLNVTQEDTTSTKLNAAKTFLQNLQQTPEIYYPAEVPELIDLGQLPELLKTFNGINNVWAETNLGNTEIEIEYVQDVKKLLEKQAEQQNARLDNIEALLSTTETSALLLDNMQTDLEKEVK